MRDMLHSTTTVRGQDYKTCLTSIKLPRQTNNQSYIFVEKLGNYVNM